MNRVYAVPQTNPVLTEPLTERERQVVWYTSEGYTSVEIGELMGLSFHTIRQYQKIITQKSNLRSTQFWKLREDQLDQIP